MHDSKRSSEAKIEPSLTIAWKTITIDDGGTSKLFRKKKPNSYGNSEPHAKFQNPRTTSSGTKRWPLYAACNANGQGRYFNYYISVN
jgi:hypothetical protein